MTPSNTPDSNSVNPLLRIERQTLREGREWTRRQLQTRLQAEADRLGPISPHSGRKLKKARRVAMVLRTVSGPVNLMVWYGRCRQYNRNLSPVREVWHLAAYHQMSPELEQRMCYTATETGSFEKAARMAAAWDCAISDDAIHACVGRKGQEALDVPLTASLPVPPNPFTLIIMMDGWLARHRAAQWGEKPPEKKAERIEWHEIKSAVIFRLEDRGQADGGRRFLIHKQVVAMPVNTEPSEFSSAVYREAIRMGMAKARKIYVVQDGAVYLWSIFEDRFAKVAQGVLDFYHASDHLWALAHELFGQDSPEASRWAHTLLHKLRHGKDQRVVKALEDLMIQPPPEHVHATEIIEKTAQYFLSHKDHIHYDDLAQQEIPIGSGAMESQCSQFQNRLKRRGQFWTPNGSGRLLALVQRAQNGELLSLWAA